MSKNHFKLEDLIKQTDPELCREHHLWACNSTALRHVAEILAGRAMTAPEVMAFSKDAKDKGFLKAKQWVQEPVNLIRLAATHLGIKIKVVVHNTESYNLAKIKANPKAFWRIEYATRTGSHFTLMSNCGAYIDPHCDEQAGGRTIQKTSGTPIRMRRIDAEVA